jgi:hypothetical protein
MDPGVTTAACARSSEAATSVAAAAGGPACGAGAVRAIGAAQRSRAAISVICEPIGIGTPGKRNGRRGFERDFISTTSILFITIRPPGAPMPRLTPEQLEDLRQIDSPTISNAIERFKVRPRVQGFAGWDLRCAFPELGSLVG